MMGINLRTLDLNLLRVLVALSETGSVSKAAAILSLSQPATSNSLARLRDATGDQLFVRARHSMVPTPFADSILPGVRLHLNGLFNSLDGHNGFDPQNSTRRFRLSLSGLGEMIFLPPLLKKAYQKAPNIQFENLSTPTSSLGAALENGEVDCAIGLINVQDRGVKSSVLYSDTYVVVAGRGLKRDPKSLSDLQQERVALSVPSASYGAEMTRILNEVGLEDNIKVRLANFGVLPGLLNDLPLISILPKQLADLIVRSDGARILPVELPQPENVVRLVWHARSEVDPANCWLRSQITELHGQMASL